MQQTAGGLEKAGADGAAGSLNEQSTFVERMRQWYGRAQALRNKRREQDGPAAPKARARWERRPGGRLARKRESGSGAGELRAAVERSGAGAAAAAAKAATETSAGSGLDNEDDRGTQRSDESSKCVAAAAKSKDYMAAPTGEDNLTNDEDSNGDGGGEVQLKRAGRAKAKAEAAREAERDAATSADQACEHAAADQRRQILHKLRAGTWHGVSGLSAFPRCRFPRLPWPVRSTCSFSCREDGSIFCLGSPRRPTSTSLARFPRRPEHGTARARLLARAPSSKSRRAFVGKTSDATLLSSRGG